MSTLLEVHDLDLTIDAKPLCRGLSLRIEAGQSWALLGRNGIGKTTLLHALAGLAPVQRGGIRLGGDPIGRLAPRERARRVGVLLQHSDPGFGASVRETVLSGRHPHLSPLAWEGDDDLAASERCIADVGLQALAARPLDALSGGELRRVEIARLLVQDCPLALLDEPLNHLDFAHRVRTCQLLETRCVGDTRAMLMVLHDLDIAYRYCDHWLLLGDGEWHAGRRESLADGELLSRVFDHPVGRIDADGATLFRPLI